MTGRVLESRAGNPVAEVFATLRRPGESLQPRSTTDDRGIFQFTDVAPGEMTVSVGKSGYEGQERTLVLTADTSLVFSLVPRLYLLSGRVTEVSTGTPLTGATLTVLDGPNATRAAVTDNDGVYRFVDLAYSGFPIRVRMAGYDPVFAGIGLSGDMVRNFELRRAEQSLAGTWTGAADFTTGQRFTFPEVTLLHTGTTLTNFTGEFAHSLFAFTGTITGDIGTTTAITGSLRWSTTKGNPRMPTHCTGTGGFTGTVSWTALRITAPRVVYDCADEPAVGITLALARQQ